MIKQRQADYDCLFAPLQLGSCGPNRLVFAAHQTNFATHHRFEKRHAAYYAARAAGGAGVIVLEGSVVHPSDWPYEYADLRLRPAGGRTATGWWPTPSTATAPWRWRT